MLRPLHPPSISVAASGVNASLSPTPRGGATAPNLVGTALHTGVVFGVVSGVRCDRGGPGLVSVTYVTGWGRGGTSAGAAWARYAAAA